MAEMTQYASDIRLQMASFKIRGGSTFRTVRGDTVLITLFLPRGSGPVWSADFQKHAWK